MNRIKDLRAEKGISQNELAKALGLTQQAISAYENGLREPDLETLQKIADFFNVSIDYLLGRSDIRNPTDEITEAVEDDPELLEFWNELKQREDLKLLFKQTRKLSPKDIKQVIRIIKAIEEEESNE
ncbi:helix-turn-helix domain-containing protein [Caldanaerobacter sp.]|uniref:helix-turn-helix domain-containing protein n=1 Tax=Caldanaerobacter sp. TaxID=2930036 RepID=UPI003C78BAAA